MAELTVSQTLRKIKDLKGRLAKGQANAAKSVLFLDSAKPAYEFKTELESSDNLSRELIRLQTALAVACATAPFEWEGRKTVLTWAVKRLEELKGQIKWFSELAVAAQAERIDESWEYTYVDGQNQRVRVLKKTTCSLPEADRDKRVRDLQDEFNRLNDQVETINHRTSVKLEG